MASVEGFALTSSARAAKLSNRDGIAVPAKIARMRVSLALAAIFIASIFTNYY
jgi:hypothetical protein